MSPAACDVIDRAPAPECTGVVIRAVVQFPAPVHVPAVASNVVRSPVRKFVPAGDDPHSHRPNGFGGTAASAIDAAWLRPGPDSHPMQYTAVAVLSKSTSDASYRFSLLVW